MRRLCWVLICLFWIVLPSYGADNLIYELRVVKYQGSKERVLFRAPISPLDTFQLIYIHSWDKCPIYEIFQVEKNGTVTLLEEVYGWFGAGLEFNPPKGFSQAEDRLIHIKEVNRNFPEIPLRVGWVSDFRLVCKNQIVFVDSLASPGELIFIKIFMSTQ